MECFQECGILIQLMYKRYFLDLQEFIKYLGRFCLLVSQMKYI